MLRSIIPKGLSPNDDNDNNNSDDNDDNNDNDDDNDNDNGKGYFIANDDDKMITIASWELEFILHYHNNNYW